MRLCLLLMGLVLVLAAVPAAADSRATCYTTWDDDFFYFATQVDDSNVVGTSTLPNTPTWNDDSVEVFLEVDNKRAEERTNRTFQMSVSAAGGSGWVVGEAGKPVPKPIFTYKYARQVQGTLNNPEDIDMGFTVELAMPWSEMGMRPTAGTTMSFNVIIRCRGDEDRFVSLSPNVKSEEDVHNPSKWVSIIFTGPAFAAVTADIERIVSARYIARVPLIDGQLTPREWNRNTSFEIAIPVTPEQRAAQLPVRSLQRLAITHYYYWYQGDARRPFPLHNVRSEEGGSMLANHPISGEGPWFSYDRVSWHKKELSDIRDSGIDVVLPVYRGDRNSRKAYASKGLDVMVEALKELKAERKPYPLVGMLFDTSAIAPAYGEEKPDLKDVDVQRAFYGMIRDFFLRVPKEFRATAHLLDERAGQPAYIVQISSSEFAADFDESFLDYCNERFQEDFGARLCWIGDASWKGKGFDLDGYCSYGGSLGPNYDEDGRIRIATIGPGYDDSVMSDNGATIRSRMGGQTYLDDWASVLSNRPHWIILDSWNGFHVGSDLCGSRQYGLEYVNTTAQQLSRMRAQREYDSKILRHNVPPVIAPGGFSHVTFLIKNDGKVPWKSTEGYALTYTWFQNGRPYREGMGTPPIPGDLLPGDAQEVTIAVAAVARSVELITEQKLTPIEEGEYELVFEIMRLQDNKRFSALGDEAFVVPVRVEEVPERDATFISVSAPTLVQGGKDYPATIRVRNDSHVTWKASEVNLTARVFKSQSYTHDTEDLLEPVEITFNPIRLPKDVQPGTIVDIRTAINARDAHGNPLPPWDPEKIWSYLLRWEIADSSGTIATYDQILGVFEHDAGAVFVDCDLPSKITAGKTHDVKVVIRNNGTEVWTPETHAIGVHWYYLDGVEALWDSGPRTPVREEMKPGDVRIFTIQVTAPPYDGQYVAAFDLAVGGRWASTEPIARGGDILHRLVSVTDGKLVFLDLTDTCNVNVISPDTERSSGDFDGRGHSFPAEMMPPEFSEAKVELDVYPSGYRYAGDSGPESQRRISFRYPNKSEGANSAVACSGQSIAVPPGKYKAIHILGASDGENETGTLTLSYPGTTETAQLALANWETEPKNGELVGFATTHRHSPEGDQQGITCYLHHAMVDADPTQEMVSIRLPDNPSMRILAVTLEKAE